MGDVPLTEFERNLLQNFKVLKDELPESSTPARGAPVAATPVSAPAAAVPVRAVAAPAAAAAAVAATPVHAAPVQTAAPVAVASPATLPPATATPVSVDTAADGQEDDVFADLNPPDVAALDRTEVEVDVAMTAELDPPAPEIDITFAGSDGGHDSFEPPEGESSLLDVGFSDDDPSSIGNTSAEPLLGAIEEEEDEEEGTPHPALANSTPNVIFTGHDSHESDEPDDGFEHGSDDVSMEDLADKKEPSHAAGPMDEALTPGLMKSALVVDAALVAPHVPTEIEEEDATPDPTSMSAPDPEGQKERPPPLTTLQVFQRWSDKFLDGAVCTVFMLIITFYVLFVDDILVVLVLPVDTTLDTIVITSKFVIFILFLYELIWSAWAKYSTYFLSFFFWLDIIALVSFVPDIMLFFGYDLISDVSGLAIARAGRAARASARAARLVRVVRVVKIARAMRKANENDGAENMLDKLQRGEASNASGVGRKLINVTTNKVVAIVLMLFLVTSLAQAPEEWMMHSQAGIESLEQVFQEYGVNATFAQSHLLPAFGEAYGDDLIVIYYKKMAIYGSNDRLLKTRKVFQYSDVTMSGDTEAYVDVSGTEKLQAILNIALLVFVILVLCLGNALITRDANRLIVAPVEKILQVLRVLTKSNKALIPEAGGEGDDAEELMDMLDSIVKSSEEAQQSSDKNAQARKNMQDRLSDMIAKDKRSEMEIRLRKRENDPSFRRKNPADVILQPLDPFEDAFVEDDTIRYEMLASQKQVSLASVPRLYWKLLHPVETDELFNHVFFMTYREFSNPHELLEVIIIRYCTTIPDHSAEEDPGEADTLWRNQVLTPIRIKCIQILGVWINNFYCDFKLDRELTVLLSSVLAGLLPDTGQSGAAGRLREIFERRARGDPVNPLQKPIEAQALPEMEAKGKVSVEGMSSLEAARQMALLEFSLYRAVQINEMFGCCWSKEGKEDKAPNVIKLIDHFNHMTSFVQTQILICPTPKSRAARIAKFVDVCRCSLDMRNFNGAFEIIAGLSAASISRLKKTWAEVDNATQEKLDAMMETLSAMGSYKEYRRIIRENDIQVSVPYIGMYLGDIILTDEGNESKTDGMINFAKWVQTTSMITELMSWRCIPFPFLPLEGIQDFFLKSNVLSEKALYDLSLTQEPRQKKRAA